MPPLMRRESQRNLLQPWKVTPPGTDTFTVNFHAPLDERARGDLEQVLGALPEDTTLGHAALKVRTPPKADLQLVPTNRTDPIPPPNGRGTAFDLVLCLLLGLAPLIFTPESWFLLWVSSRARSMTMPGRTNIGWVFWPVYALFVGVYWLMTLQGTSRIAAFLPLLAGLAQLAAGGPKTPKGRFRATIAPPKR